MNHVTNKPFQLNKVLMNIKQIFFLEKIKSY